MNPVNNPYSPGAGSRPTAFVGRDTVLSAWDDRLSRIELGRTAQSVVLYGLRGVGKTVLLAELARRAEARDWIVARFEAGGSTSLRSALGEALYPSLADLARPSVGARILKALKTAASFKASYDAAGAWTFGLDLEAAPGGGADTGMLETDVLKLIRDVSAALEGVGLAILIDEAQDLSEDELLVISSTLHRASQDQWPILVGLAGLPSLPRILAESRAYTERLYAYEHIEHLGDGAAADALIEPARSEGADWDADAVAHVVRKSAGYPYFLQQFGQDAWNAAAASPISAADAQVGVAEGRAALDRGFFRSRWDQATRSEKAYLRAMAEDDDVPSQSGVVAERLNRRLTSLGPTRANLIAKGLIYAPEHGRVAFTVPHMASFIKRQVDGAD